MRILIAEEALQTGVGHWPAYIGDIARGLREYGDEVDVLVHREVCKDVVNRTGGIPWFSRNCWLDRKSQGAVGGLRHNLIFYRELSAWQRKHEPYDWICAFTMRLQHLLAFALLSRSKIIPNKTRFFLLFVQGFGVYTGLRKSALFPKNIATQLARFCFFLLSPAVRSGRVVLSAETKGMKDELQQFTGLQVALAPHPVNLGIASLSTPATPDPRHEYLTITCPGFARYEKGSDLLQEAISILLKRKRNQSYRFVLQWQDSFVSPDGSVIGPDPELLNDHRIEYLNKNLTPEEYFELMLRTDIVVLPYRRNSYHHRVSRVAIEASGLGIPIIYTEGTWSGEIAALSGCGLPITEESPSVIADAIEKGVENLPVFKKLAEQGAQQVREFHSLQTLRNQFQ